MDTEVISFKQILRFSAFSFIILIIITSVSRFEKKGEIVLCSEQSQLSIVMKNELKEYVFISNASVKNMLDCLGRTMPFNERRIAYAWIDNSSKLSDVSKRYHIQNISIPNTFGEYVITRNEPNMYSLSHDSEKILIYTKTPSSPFLMIEELKNSTASVYMPQNSSQEEGVLQKMITLTGERIKVLTNGEFYRREVLF